MVKPALARCTAISPDDGSGVTVTQDADIEEILRRVQVDSWRRLAERLRNELDEVRKDRDAWRSRAAETAVAKPAGWLRRLAG
jgi:hypothetical protein